MRSKDAIQKAFVDLMKTRTYDEITVKDLAEAARINRKTFYAHYETKQALFESMMGEMFDEICSCFMYDKPVMDAEPMLKDDIRRFLQVTEKYREQLDVMITDQTATMTFIVSEQAIIQRAQAIHILPEVLPGRVPVELYTMRLKNFFLSVMDWWLGQQKYTLDEATEILYKAMRTNLSSVFRYQRKC